MRALGESIDGASVTSIVFGAVKYALSGIAVATGVGLGLGRGDA